MCAFAHGRSARILCSEEPNICAPATIRASAAVEHPDTPPQRHTRKATHPSSSTSPPPLLRASSIAFSSSYPLLIRTLDVLLTCTSIRPATSTQNHVLSHRSCPFASSCPYSARRAPPLPQSRVVNHACAPAELAPGGHSHFIHLKLRHIVNASTRPSPRSLHPSLPPSRRWFPLSHRTRSPAGYALLAPGYRTHPRLSRSVFSAPASLTRAAVCPSPPSKPLTLVRTPLSARPIDIMQAGRPSIRRSTSYMRLRELSFERQVQHRHAFLATNV